MENNRDVIEELASLVLEIHTKGLTHYSPQKAQERAQQLLKCLGSYPQDDRPCDKDKVEKCRLLQGLTLYYLREIYDQAFLADVVDRLDTDADDKVNEAILAEERYPKALKWWGAKPAYRIKTPFCNDRYTHKFVDEWYAERRYAIGTYGSIVIQLPSAEARESKSPPNSFHTIFSWCFAQGWITDAVILIILLLGGLLPLWGNQCAGFVYPGLLVIGVAGWAYLWSTRGPHVIKAMVPRLAGCAIVGLVPPVATQDAWKFSFRMWEHQAGFWFSVLMLLFASWLYLFIETHNRVGKGTLSARRAFHILLRLCNFALFFSWWATGIISTLVPSLVYERPAVEIVSLWRGITLTVPLPTSMLFATLAVFIGIFLQILWHDRPITSRL